MKLIFTGIRTPQLATPSGIALRITPENALWLNKHTAGLTLNTSCPLDLPTLISFKKPSWVVIGDTGTKEEIFFTGKLPEKLKNYEIAFSCSITQNEQGFFLGNTASPVSFIIPLTAPDGWVWINGKNNPLKLNSYGISLSINTSQNKAKIPVPKENLMSALPFPKRSSSILSKQWEGLSNLLDTEKGTALFSWTAQEKIAFGIVITGELSDEEAVALTYDLANVPTHSQKILREDEISYTTATRNKLSIISINSMQKEIQLPDGTPVAFVVLQDGFSLFSTAQTIWELSAPRWEAELSSEEEFEKHTPHTLASFGKKIFTTKKTINILNK